MQSVSSRLTRIGVFYDGNYFLHVSNYYNYSHERRSRISISGLHAFIRQQVAEREGVNERLCQIVDAHYFRGRLNAHEANQRGNQLFYDRLFDDILMSEGVVTHYLPVKTYQGYRQEKGIDVWLALEAFELTLYKKFDVIVLITSDGDYVPLIRKLNTVGSRIMVLSWDFEFENEQGERQVTRTSQDLLEEVSYPVAMHAMIDDRTRRNDPIIQNLFVKQASRPTFTPATATTSGNSFVNSQNSYAANFEDEDEPNYNLIDRPDDDPTGRKISTVRSLKSGYGFINYPPNNLFFHYTSLIDTEFDELHIDDEVEFTLGQNPEGKDIAVDVSLVRS
ncbi:NYN domain-containing protein [Spirosoma rhododendri]|uniref:NYN domain-containing protein n=1 Tax=Spirosoma rhododendri TaxID=2728024 RepID=A0A7L5DNT0_9BACT|nr:NYN domain-containing protein [Spirosoma rhododendri]QJD77410.1 NYN domain-containing protein [Spirosoma rhododendri]